MKQFPLIGLLGMSLLGTSAAQVASHAPALAKPAPSQGMEVVSLAGAGSDKPVVRVNGAVLTEADLRREELAIFPYAGQHNGIPKDMEGQIRDGAMKMMVFEELVYQEAQKRKLSISPSRLATSEADFRKRFASPEEFKTFLNAEFQGSEQKLTVKIQRSLLIDTILKQEVDSKSTPTAAEIRDYYDKNISQFSKPESYRFQTISVLPSDKTTIDQSRRRAEEALKQAKATKSAEEFGLLAEKLSDDDFRVMMGQHKPVPADQLAPQVLKALATMKPDQVSDLLQVEQAFTIVRLQEHLPAERKKFEDVRSQIATGLQKQKANQLRGQLDKQLQQNAKVEKM